MRVFISLCVLSISVCLYAQIKEDFEDGNLSDGTPLTWSPSQISGGDDFAIVSGELNSNGPSATSTIFVSSSQSIDFINNDVIWTFKVRYTGGVPSSSNYVEVYLISDIPNLSTSPNGYYIRLGESGSADGIDLFKTNSSTAVIADESNLIAASLDAHIRVTRTGTGGWTLEADAAGGNSFAPIDSVNDTDFTSGDYFGFLVRHSSTRNQSYFFDDFTQTITPIPDTTPPNLSGVSTISSTAVDITFNEDVDQTTAENSANYDIDGGISVVLAQRDASDHSLVHLTTSTLTNGVDYSLTVDNVEDESGNAIASPIQADFSYLALSTASFRDIQINEFLADPTPSQGLPEVDFVELYNPTSNYYDLDGWQVGDAVGQSGAMASFVLAPDSYVIICPTTNVSDFEVFGDAIGVSSFPNFNSSTDDVVKLYNDGDVAIDSIAYSGSDVPDDGITLEQVSPNRTCSGIFNFAPSSDASGGTPDGVNSAFMLDNMGPNLITALVISEDSLRFDFDEVIDQTSVQVGDITFLPNLITTEVYTLGGYPESVFLKLGETLVANDPYQATLTGVTDCAGNGLASGMTSFTLRIFSTPNFRDVQINEFIANPTPSVGLPEVDFVELFNPTSNYYDLDGWQVGDAIGQSASLANYVLEPDSYVIVCSTSDVEDFEVFGDAIGVSSFPNFNSSSDVVAVYSDLGTAVDLVTYGNNDLPVNGISLELVNPNLACSGIFNFEPSLHENGGTPGAENSVLMIVPDKFGPNLTTVRALTSDSIRLDFDEAIDPATTQTGAISFQPAQTIETIYALDDYPQSVFIKLTQAIQPNTSIEITVTGFQDCSGNEVDEGTLSFLLGLEPDENDILLSEVLFDPRREAFDFVEIFNPSATENFELKGWKLARIFGGIVEDEEEIAPESLLIEPRQFLVFTENASDLAIQYPSGNSEVFVELSGLPSYSNDEGSIVLLNSDSEVVQQLDYKDDYHYELLEDVEGVSLERVSYDKEVNDPNNWRSAASTVGFATPGRVNSQSAEIGIAMGQLEIEPKVFLPGNTGSGRDFTVINYSFNQGGKFANIIIYDQSGRQVKQIANGASLSTSGFFRWDGTTDSGSIARMGYHVVVFEVFDGNGKKNTLKETVVVGRSF
ncbi:MAG: hypothetical protein GY816_05280 [Cytophagales bacterium]|nr:hypothetical protein [Cytophagales bacterium]